MNNKELEFLLKSGESDKLEFKESLSVKDQNLLKENGNKPIEYQFHALQTKAIIYSQIYLPPSERVTERVTENQKKIIEEINKNSLITAKELAVIVGISERKIKANISKLKAKGIIKRIGPDRGGHWQITGNNQNKKE